MKILTNTYGEIRIRWQYNITNGDRDVTKAFLEKKVGEKKDIELIKEVSVIRRPTEKYSKEKARFFALTKLVKESFDRGQAFEDRKNIWNTYRTRSPKVALPIENFD